MKRLSTACLVALTACASTDLASEQPLNAPLRVLLLGDSISLGYTQTVIDELAGEAEVLRPLNANGKGYQNCSGTNNAAARLEDWLRTLGEEFDVIHFNFGLHDLKRVEPGTGKNSNDASHPHQADPERYGRQLRAITERLQATGARLVFALTTPVPEGAGGPYRAPADAVTYNAVARAVMTDLGVPINDLYAFALERIETIQKPKDVHFSKEGSGVLGREVARVIRARAGWEAKPR
ncbi:MAG: SGNH/GDSL hydrolase family protein [Planctomycetota bacterium]|nr:SGNH/GDSL hydrolase family protein [Planctomycetota bacterium]